MTTDIFANLDAAIETFEANRRCEEAERNAQKSALIDAATAAIHALIATLDEPAAALLARSLCIFSGRGSATAVTIEAQIETEGIGRITLEANASAYPTTASVLTAYAAGHTWYQPSADDLRAALIAARAEWLHRRAKQRENEEKIARGRMERQQREQADRATLDAALAAWEPAYRAYLSDLDAVYTHNSGVLRRIASTLETMPFEARRLTYGIVYGEGADPATESTWIKGDSTRGGIEEIGQDGIVFDTRYYFPVSVTALQTWTPAKCKEISGWSTSNRPPIRTTTINSGPLTVKIAAPPSRSPLDAEIETAIFAAGGLLDWPPAPAPPTAPTQELEELIVRRAADLAAEHLSTAAGEEIGMQAIRAAVDTNAF